MRVYCLTNAFFGSVRICTRSSSVSSSREHDDRNAADEFRNHAELVQVLGQHLGKQLGFGMLLAFGHIVGKADARACPRAVR